MNVKKLLLPLVFLLFLLKAEKSLATHLAVSCITYEYIGPNQYILTLKIYQDCAVGSPWDSMMICYSSVSLNYSNVQWIDTASGSGTILQPIYCFAGTLSTCNGGTSYGIKEWIYQDTVTLPAAAADWIFSWNNCCRVSFITTLMVPSGVGTYLYTTLDNLNIPVNSSPQFQNPSLSQYCTNVLSTYGVSCFDPDGDSLHFSLVPVQGGGLCPGSGYNLNYNPPYSGTNPVASSTPIIFDPATGNLTFTPNLQQVAVIGMLIQEYRNGQLIGEVKREELLFNIHGFVSSIESSKDFSELLITPNPANDILNIEMNLKESSHLQIQLFNLLGKLESEIENKVQSGIYKKQININNLSAGIYFIRIADEQATGFYKIVRQ